MQIKTLTIVGVGLIGGSIGLAARQRGLAERIVGVGRQRSSLDRALASGAIDEGCLDLKQGVQRAEIAVFCTPVDRIVEQVLTAAAGCGPGILLTDAGSTKAVIVEALDGRLPRGVAFVGSHPLAGSEKQGPEHADPRLFQERLTVVTPTDNTDPEALTRTKVFWEALGARVRVMSPQAHDRALAMTSHLPHLLASALAGILPPEYHDLTATGFRDTTRVAAGDPNLWSGIFAQNCEAVQEALTQLRGRLDDFQKSLLTHDQDTLTNLLRQAKRTRDALGS